MRIHSMEGEHMVFQIEAWIDVGDRSGPRWCTIDVDRLDTGEPQGIFGQPHGQFMPISNAFSANGACWQRFGIHGVFDIQMGEAALDACTKTAHRSKKFRLVRRTYGIKTEVVEIRERFL